MVKSIGFQKGMYVITKEHLTGVPSLGVITNIDFEGTISVMDFETNAIIYFLAERSNKLKPYWLQISDMFIVTNLHGDYTYTLKSIEYKKGVFGGYFINLLFLSKYGNRKKEVKTAHYKLADIVKWIKFL